MNKKLTSLILSACIGCNLSIVNNVYANENINSVSINQEQSINKNIPQEMVKITKAPTIKENFTIRAIYYIFEKTFVKVLDNFLL